MLPIIKTFSSIAIVLLSFNNHHLQKNVNVFNGTYLHTYCIWYQSLFLPLTLNNQFVTQHEKTMLMYTKYTSLHYFSYLTFCVSCASSVNCIGFPMVSCTIIKSFIDTMLRQEVVKVQSLKKLYFCVHKHCSSCQVIFYF